MARAGVSLALESFIDFHKSGFDMIMVKFMKVQRAKDDLVRSMKLNNKLLIILKYHTHVNFQG